MPTAGEIAKRIVTDYFCFHVPDLMRNGETEEYWIERQTEDIVLAIESYARSRECEAIEKAAKLAEKIDDEQYSCNNLMHTACGKEIARHIRSLLPEPEGA